MTYAAKILADSVADGVRLTTLEVTIPRIVLAEFNTHRMLSRNSASSRAIPVEKRIRQVEENPFVPEAFGANQKGMIAGACLAQEHQALALSEWLMARNSAVKHAQELVKLGVHKQWANRILEPYMWQTVIVSATEWDNFYALRISPEAQPEIRRVAELMKKAMDESTPAALSSGQWHLPLIFEDDIAEVGDDVLTLAKISCARCARVSYLTHEGKRDLSADLALAERLSGNGHMSPFEHAARVAEHGVDYMIDLAPFIGNFKAPWIQYRKLLPGEAVFTGGQ